MSNTLTPLRYALTILAFFGVMALAISAHMIAYCGGTEDSIGYAPVEPMPQLDEPMPQLDEPIDTLEEHTAATSIAKLDAAVRRLVELTEEICRTRTETPDACGESR